MKEGGDWRGCWGGERKTAKVGMVCTFPNTENSATIERGKPNTQYQYQYGEEGLDGRALGT